MRATYSFLLLLLMLIINSYGISIAQVNSNQNIAHTSSIESINLLIQKAKTHTNDSTLLYGKEALSLSDNSKYKYGQIKSRLIVADYYRAKKDLVAINYLNEAQELMQNFNNDTLLAWLSFSKARYYFHLKLIFPEAIKNILKAIELYIKLDDKDNLSQAYNLCGMIYNDQGQSQKAIEYFNKAITIAKSINNLSSVAYISNCISGIYIENKQYDKAQKYNNEALRLYNLLGNKAPTWGIAWSYAYTGSIYFETAQIAWDSSNKAKAISLFNNALDIYKKRLSLELKTKSGSIDSYWDLANWYIKMIQLKQAPSVKNYTLIAENYLKKSLTNAQNEHVLSGLVNAYLSQSIIDSIRGDFKAANENINLYRQLKDSMQNQQNSEKAIRLEMQNNFENAANATKLAQEKKDLKYKMITQTILVGLIALMLFSIFIFRQRALVKKEKKQNDALLLNILPQEVANELKTTGKVQTHLYNEVSVMLIDFVGFTNTVADMNPKELIQNLNVYFTAFDKIIEKYGLEKIKTIGDAYLAVCGLPISNELHAQKTTQAALDIIHFVKVQQHKRSNFNVRIGINSGSVVAGIVGVKKFAYDIWGDTVNTAARMEQNSEPGKVNISETTYELVKEDFNCVYRDEVEAKNKGILKMYFVENKNIETIKNL